MTGADWLIAGCIVALVLVLMLFAYEIGRSSR